MRTLHKAVSYNKKVLWHQIQLTNYKAAWTSCGLYYKFFADFRNKLECLSLASLSSLL